MLSQRLAALATAAALVLAGAAITSPAAAFPGLVPVVTLPGRDISIPPRPVGAVTCANGLVWGNFTDVDQDDATLRVYVTSEGDVPIIEHPTYRAWGTFIGLVPHVGSLITLVAYDDDGNRALHYGGRVRRDGTCPRE